MKSFASSHFGRIAPILDKWFRWEPWEPESNKWKIDNYFEIEGITDPVTELPFKIIVYEDKSLEIII